MTQQQCSYCNQFKELTSFEGFKMCLICRTENTKERKEQRAANAKEGKYKCECCNYSASGGALLRNHNKTQKHLQQVFADECARLGMAAGPAEARTYVNPMPIEQRFKIREQMPKKYYSIEWREDGVRYQERFSYCRRPKEEAMAEALEMQAELRTE